LASEHMWSCALCGQTNPGDNSFCQNCGARRDASWACAWCGQSNPGDYTFCVRCGAKRSIPVTPVQQTSVSLQELINKAIAKAEESLSTPEHRERISSMDETVRKRVVGYLKAEERRRVRVASVAARFSLTPQQVEDIIYEAIADGKMEGYIDDKTQEFVLVTREETAKPAVIHVGGDYIAGTSVRDSVVTRSSLGEKTVKKCASCNREIPVECVFCPECGSRA
jgi:hypothetical protein